MARLGLAPLLCGVQPAAKKVTLADVAGERNRRFVGPYRLVVAAKPLEQVGPDRMEQAVVLELESLDEQ